MIVPASVTGSKVDFLVVVMFGFQYQPSDWSRMLGAFAPVNRLAGEIVDL